MKFTSTIARETRSKDSLIRAVKRFRSLQLAVGGWITTVMATTHYDDFDALLTLSGFPEPFFSGSKTERDRWARSDRELLGREDLRDLEPVISINKIEHLALRLPELVASPLSLNSLREDLNVSHTAITDWFNILERLYYIFRLRP